MLTISFVLEIYSKSSRVNLLLFSPAGYIGCILIFAFYYIFVISFNLKFSVFIRHVKNIFFVNNLFIYLVPRILISQSGNNNYRLRDCAYSKIRIALFFIRHAFSIKAI